MFGLYSSAKRLTGKQDTKSIEGGKAIEFLCEERFYGAIAEPQPANKVLPEWYKNLDFDITPGLGSSTVKKCMPFLDAMTAGWIIPLAAETEIDCKRDGKVEASWNFSEPMVDSHDVGQIGGQDHPMGSMGVLKFNNYWAIKVPKGYSVLFTSPLNRVESRFQVFSGVVDCDEYFNFINFPFIWTGGKYHGVLEKGTPIVQAIPFKRDGLLGDGEIGKLDGEDIKHLENMSNRLEAEESHYKSEVWKGKNASRVVDRE